MSPVAPSSARWSVSRACLVTDRRVPVHESQHGIVAAESGAKEGYEALASGDWMRARAAFEGALAVEELPRGAGWARPALWWLREPEQAFVYRERALGFSPRRAAGATARTVLWLAREYAPVWATRRQRTVGSRVPSGCRRMSPRTRSGMGGTPHAPSGPGDPVSSGGLAANALEVAMRTGDADLELRALTQLGLAEGSHGEVDSDLARLDEAMAATGGEPATLETFADVCCTLMLACELAGDVAHPAAWPAEIRVLQGRFDEAGVASVRVRRTKQRRFRPGSRCGWRVASRRLRRRSWRRDGDCRGGRVGGDRREASAGERVAAQAALAQGRIALGAEDPRAPDGAAGRGESVRGATRLRWVPPVRGWSRAYACVLGASDRGRPCPQRPHRARGARGRPRGRRGGRADAGAGGEGSRRAEGPRPS